MNRNKSVYESKYFILYIHFHHCGNHSEFSTGLHSSEVNGLTDIDRARATAFGTHIVKKLTKAMDLP